MDVSELAIFLKTRRLADILQRYPIVADFLANYRLDNLTGEYFLDQALLEIDEEHLAEFGVDRYGIFLKLCDFLEKFTLKDNFISLVSSITILGGFNKSGEPEDIQLTIQSGEVLSIVGPTGSGKSRLLGDIECLAQRDTPTGRQILVNGTPVDDLQRFEMEGKLVAQLSQNMNFVMDLTVGEFLAMHARSRLISDPAAAAETCWRCANELAGEMFSQDIKITQLSGGQSRALMIADTAHISDSPIVLIDEIENAGIDRKQAIELLAKKDKIVLVSTHDPLLALSADKRIVIKNGGIDKVIAISEDEKRSLSAIETLDKTLQVLRNRLRRGELIGEELLKE
jgi:ABC-type lipoprotein export system ATPase subunit